MNRAQRRSKGKGTAHGSVKIATGRFSLTMAKCDATLAGEADADELTISPLANIERLSRGTLNDEGFIDLNESNVAAFCIAARIHKLAANEETKALILQALPHFEAASNALAEIGTRKIKIDRYVCKGEELNAIRESVRLYREVIMVSEKGLIMKSLIQAKEMVDNKLQQVWRENERIAA